MGLPERIEIEPLRALPQATITVPGSKSITNRALILAALAEGETRLHGALWSEDTQVMVEGLRKLGFRVHLEADPGEPSNRIITIGGLNGRIPQGGSVAEPSDLFVGNAGTAARFLAAFVCLGHGVYRLHGSPRMHERPQAPLFQALRALGYRIDTPNDRLPAVVHGGGRRGGTCQIGLAGSSQFASALLLSATAGDWQVAVEGEDAEESSYVEMTRQLGRVFPSKGGAFFIEPDASSGSYFWGVNALFGRGSPEARTVQVAHWPTSGWQIDARLPDLLPLSRPLSRRADLADAIMTAIVLAPFAGSGIHFSDLGRLRVQECERVAALRTELLKCGARVEEQGDTLQIEPSALHGAEIDTYNDHRMAMCFAMLGLKVPGLRIHQPVCVKKTFPSFFQKLAAPPPAGLGAEMFDAATRARLTMEQLNAE